MTGWDVPQVEPVTPLTAAPSAPPKTDEAWASTVLGALGLVSIALPWVKWQTLDGDGSRSGWSLPAVGWLTMIAAAGLLLAGTVGLAKRRQVPRALLVALLVWMGAPAAVVLAVTEAVRNSVIGWLMPAISGGRLVTAGGAIGARAVLLASIVGTVVVVVGPRRGLGSLAGLRSNGHSAPTIAVVVSALVVVAARALPLYRVEITEVRTGQEVVDRVASDAAIEIAAGDIPLLAPATFAALAGVIVVAVLALRTMSDWLVTIAGAAGGTMLFGTWLSLALVDLPSAVVPDGWLSLAQDHQVVEVAVTPWLWVTGAASTTFLAAAAFAHRADPPGAAQ